MSGIPDLGKQVGPLPLGAWIAVVAGGLGIAYYTRGSGFGAASQTVVDDTGTPTNGPSGAVEGSTGDGSVGGWVPTTPDSTGGTAAPSTNEEWANLAINWLIAQGYDPAWSYSAITKAMSGGRGENRLTVREYALWRAALRKFGAPPVALNVPPPGAIPKHHKPKKPPHQTPPTKPEPHPGPKSFRYFRVTKAPLPGSTLKSLAQMYYKDGSKWHRIYDANRAGSRRADGTPGLISDPNKLHVGWKLLIPR